ncbi:hypothetical protein BGZ93_001023 [Podila epicladia]|nr:hypothetical protein BGZ93_001023 [Podila epicladia]
MRFLALLMAALAFATVALATPVPADDDFPMPSISLPVPLPTDIPTPNMDKCHSCLVTNIRKVKACNWWNQKTPWLPPGDWNIAQRACICSLSKDDDWLEECQMPDWCPGEYVGKLKNKYAGWKSMACSWPSYD